MTSNELFHIMEQHIATMITMIFGSFIAGSSPEGSASVAYPIFTLYLGIEPDSARNFAFAIQSIGMTSATIFILNKKLSYEKNYVKYVTLGGILGLIIGTYYIVPFIQPKLAKLSFVSIWLSFGMILYYLKFKGITNVKDKRVVFRIQDIAILLFLGVIGGFISSVFGTGINIFSFCFIVIYYGLDEKIAAKSSIIIMTIETIIGFFLHAVIIKDFSTSTYHMWLSCIPIVIFFAPLGTFILSKISNKIFSNFLYIIFLIQYLGAIYVIRPGLYLSLLSVLVISTSCILFYYIYQNRRIDKY